MELDMTKGSPAKLILKFIIPVILGNIFQQLYNVVDTIIVGQFVGVEALAAVGATGTICFLIMGFTGGLTSGFTVIVSQRFGAGDREGVKKSVGSAYILSFIVTVIITTISITGMDRLLTVMQTPEDIYEMSKDYIIVICLGLGLNILYNLLSGMMRAVGNSKVPLYFLIIAAFLNVGLDLLFIIVFKMGVAGAAWATIASQGVSGILCLIYIMKRVPVLRIERRHLVLDKWCVNSQLSLGIPMALQYSITAIGSIMVQTTLNMLGSTIVAAYTVAGKAEQFVTQVYGAMGITMSTYVAQNRGVGNVERIKKGTKIAFLMTTVYSIVVFVALEAALPWVVQLFVAGDISDVIGYARTYVTICGLAFSGLGAIFIYRNAMQGCGYSFLPMMGGVLEMFSRGIIAVISAHFMSYEGVCCANGVTWVITAVYLWVCYRHMLKTKGTMMESKAVD